MKIIRSIRSMKDLSEKEFLTLFFTGFSTSFLVAALFMPDWQDILPGLLRILSQPTKGSTNFFSVGGYAATFFNMGLVGLICTAMYIIPGEKPNHAATLVTILTTGFGSWGIHILNMWPTMLGVMLHAVVRREKLGDHTNQMLFSTGLAPFMSELMVRYPNPEVTGFSLPGVAIAFAVGITVGFFLPAGLSNSPTVHKGFDLYSAALPVGMTAFLLQGFLYRASGIPVPDAVSDLSVSSWTIANTFCIILFSSCVIIAFIMGCGPKEYWKLMSDPEPVVNFSATYGNATMLMNVGLYGFFILAYYNIIGAEFNGVTFGVMFCMLSTCNAGSHPANVWPITLGYGLASMLFQLLAVFTGGEFTQYLHSQAIIVGLCYANGLSPIGDKYGWRYGLVAAMMHFCMVTTVPELHGSMCLYNGGFTAALVCLLMIPGLERNFKTKLERRAARALAKENK
ncbi:MAG: DUF1576 domain-containing protein [Oscillospiraceae bacterium]|nr:DUF1576 domain-containing protein [Oscillospiraceae bacterium]